MAPDTAAVLDEAYQRLHKTGPEFDGWLSNHGPMAAEAMARNGHAEHVRPWLDGYVQRLEEFPRERLGRRRLAGGARRPASHRRLDHFLLCGDRRPAVAAGPGYLVAAAAARGCGISHPRPWITGMATRS
jgi:hypothetical protein